MNTAASPVPYVATDIATGCAATTCERNATNRQHSAARPAAATAADSLSPLLAHVNARVRTFFTGTLCARAAFPFESGVGYMHLLRSGTAKLQDQRGHYAIIHEPTLIFYARPLSHWLDPDPPAGADFACATIEFANPMFNPVVLALPPTLQCPMRELVGMDPLLQLLFAEAFTDRAGRQEVLDRLFEIILITLLRSTVARDDHGTGLLRGLAHPQLRKAVTAVQADPAGTWTLDAMADAAHMSRSNFAAVFRREIGKTPGDFLTACRVALAQVLIQDGVPLKLVGERVGYTSQAGFLRTFKLLVGVSPTRWLRHRQFAAGAFLSAK